MADVPDGWTVTAAKEEGDWTDLQSPGGTTMQLRTIENDQESMDASTADTIEYINKNYTDVKIKADPDCAMNG